VLTLFERHVLVMLAEQGPRYAGSGSGAMFDAAWELKRRGLLRIAEGTGPVYLEFTDAGREAHASITPESLEWK